MTANTPNSPQQTDSARRVLRLPPEEQFWKHYSPHHEFPLSSLTSLALHVLVLVLLLLVGVLAAWWFNGETASPRVDAVALSGVGGKGQDTEPGKAGPADGPREDRPGAPGAGPAPTPHLPDLPDSPDEPIRLTLPPRFKDDRGLQELWQKLEQVRDGSSRIGGDRGGPGSARGPDGGQGRPLTPRQKRVLRWTMTFNTQNGEDYLRQLRLMRPGEGAILAVPTDGGYKVYHDLSSFPLQGRIEDVDRIQRIFWIDDKPESVKGLAHALKIPPPPYIVAFFPQELEEYLVQLEKEHAGLREDQIQETRFEVVAVDGVYKPRVVSQKARPQGPAR